MKNKIRFLAMMLIGVLLSVNQVWGAIANPYSFTFVKGDLTTSQTSYTSGEVTWSLSATANQWDGTKMGYIFGSAGTPKTLTISTDDISGTITNVSVTGRSNNSGKTATVSVKVGTTSFTTSDNSWDNGSHQTLQFSGSASGTIAVTITPDACGYGLLGISVTYSSGPSYTISATVNNGSYGEVSVSGNTITVTPNTGYCVNTSNPYTVTSGTPDVTYNGDNTFTVEADADCGVQVNLKAKELFTVTFFNDKTQLKQVQVYEGDAIGKSNLPSTPSAWHATSTEFAGWTTQFIKGNTQTTINDNQFVDSYTKVTGNMTVYALWGKTDATTSTFDASNTSNLTESDDYDEFSENTTGVILGGYDIFTAYSSYFRAEEGDNEEVAVYVQSPNRVIKQVVFTIDGTVSYYGIASVSDGSLSSTSSSPQTVSNVRTNYMEAYPNGSTIDLKKVVVTTYTNYITHSITYTDYLTDCGTTYSFNPIGVAAASDGYGTVSPTSVTGIPENSPVTVNGNKFTVNGTTVTATPSTETAEYTYAFSSWSNLPNTVTADVSNIVANFTRTARTYSVTYKDQGGADYSGSNAGSLVNSYTSGTGATLVDGTKDGHIFGGWYTNPECTGDRVTSISASESGNKTFYAKWTANWKLMGSWDSYQQNDLTEVSAHSFTFTKELAGNTTYWIRCSDGVNHVYALAGPSTMDKDNCTNWDFYKDNDKDCGLQTTAAGEYTFTINDTHSNNDDSYGYRLQVSVTYPTSVAVTMNLNGQGSNYMLYTVPGGTISAPANPSADGYAFLGWFTDQACSPGHKWDFSNTISEDMTLYAKWTESWYYTGEWDDNWALKLMDMAQDGIYWYYYTWPSTNNREFKIVHDTWYHGRECNQPGFNCTDITNMNSSGNTWNTAYERCAVNYNGGRYYIIVYPPYTDANPSNEPIICASTTLPDATKGFTIPSGVTVYFDNYTRQWSNLHLRMGRSCHNLAWPMTKVPGTANLWKFTTDGSHNYSNYWAIHVANNCAWTNNNSIYKTNTNDGNAITNATSFMESSVGSDITIIPGSDHSTGTSGDNNNCEFYSYTKQSGLLTHNAAITAPTNGTITVAYTDVNNSGQNFTSGNRDLAHTCILTISAAPATGYHFVSLTVNGTPFTSGNTLDLTEDITIAAEFAIDGYTVTYVTNGIGTLTPSDTQVEVEPGSSVTLPTVTDVSCNEYDTFIGWTVNDAEIDETTSKPTILDGPTYQPTSTVTLRAVYSKCSGSTPVTYDKVTSNLSNWSGQYLIVCEQNLTNYVFDGSLTTSSALTATNNLVSGITIEENSIAPSETQKLAFLDAMSVTLAQKTGGYSIYTASGFYIGSNSASNNISASQNNDYTNTLSYDNGNVIVDCGKVKSDTKKPYVLMCMTTGSGSPVFKYYPCTQQPIQLYKRTGGCTAYYTTHPDCTKPVGVHIIYNGNGGEMTCSQQNRTYKITDDVNQYPQLASVLDFCTDATRSGYSLTGWNTSTDGSGVSYNINTHYYTLPVSGALDNENYVTLNLYAMWARSIAFNVGNAVGGTGVPVVLYDEEKKGFVLPTPTAEQLGTIPCGYTFYGWSEESVDKTFTKPTLFMPGTTYTGSEPTLYAVYRLADNIVSGDFFNLSYTQSNITYYVGAFNKTSYERTGQLSCPTNENDAVALCLENVQGTSWKNLYYYDNGEKVYLRPNGDAYLYATLTKPTSEDAGWNVTENVGTICLVPSNAANRSITLNGTDYFNCLQSVTYLTKTTTDAPATYTYATNPSCETDATLIFITSGGVINYPTDYSSANYENQTPGTTVYLPTATYAGEWVFEGWKIGSPQESTDTKPLDIEAVELNVTQYTMSHPGTTTFYAVYSKDIEDKQFDPIMGGTYKLYGKDASGNKYYMPPFEGTTGTLGATTSCPSTGEFTITPGTGEHEGMYQITCGTYTLGINGSEDTKFKHNANAWWTISSSTSGKGTYRIVETGANTRAMSLSTNGSGTFGYYAVSQVNSSSQSIYRDMEIGECIYTEYTSTPVNVPTIMLTGAPIRITSYNGQKVYASNVIHVEAHNFDGVQRINFTATERFGANPSYIETDASGAYSGDIRIYYDPNTLGDGSIINSTLTAKQSGKDVQQTFTFMQGRNMPEDFVIVTKLGNTWYALPNDCSSSGTPAGVVVVVDDNNQPTSAIAPTNTKWQLSDIVSTRTGFEDYIYLAERGTGNLKALYSGSAPNIQVYAQLSNITSSNSEGYEWKLTTTDLAQYTIKSHNDDKNLSINESGTFGRHGQHVANTVFYLLPATYMNELTMNIVEWFPTKMLIESSQAITTTSVQVGDAEAIEAATSTATYGTNLYEVQTGNLTAKAGQTMLISSTIDATLYAKIITVPIIVSQDTYATATAETLGGLDPSMYQDNDLVVRDGATLTVDATTGTWNTFKNVTIYPNSKVVVPAEKTLKTTTTTLFGGRDEIYDGSEYNMTTYAVPQLVLKGNLEHEATIQGLRYDMRLDDAIYYDFALPYQSKYEIVTDNKGGEDFTYWIKLYDGDARAKGGTGWAWYNWNVQPWMINVGTGYLFAAQPYAGQNFIIIRHPMGYNETANPNGHQTGTPEGSKASVEVAAHPSTYDNNTGWNFIANPFMANFSKDDETNAIIKMGQLVEHKVNDKWDGHYEWDTSDGKDVRYVTTYDYTTGHYSQHKMSETVLPPFTGFFVQIAEKGQVVFDIAGRADAAPARMLSDDELPSEIEVTLKVNGQSENDETVMLLTKDLSLADAREFPAEQTKMVNNGILNFYTFGGDDVKMFANGMNYEEGQEWNKAGIMVKTAGEYTFSVASDKAEYIQQVILKDMDSNTEYDLMNNDAKIYLDKGEMNDRFYVKIVFGKHNIGTGITERYDTSAPEKFILNDHMYIRANGVLFDGVGKRVKY